MPKISAENMGTNQEVFQMVINRTWAMPNSKTFSIKPIGELVSKYASGEKVIIDPFSNDCKIGTITNDLNPKYDTDYHLDALDFLKMMKSESADVVLYDPPYSPRQVKECYEGVGITVTAEHTKASWRAKHLDEIARVVKTGGYCLSFGWNTNGVGKKRGFEIVEILIVAHGGSKNDTLCTVERKID